jgi:hypothetical protein
MNLPALGSAALALAGALIYFLIRARKNRPRDKYKEALRETSGPAEGFDPIEPEGDPQEALDRTVDGISRGFDILNACLSILIVGLVIVMAFTDQVTRIVVLVLLAVLVTIWVVGRKLG